MVFLLRLYNSMTTGSRDWGNIQVWTVECGLLNVGLDEERDMLAMGVKDLEVYKLAFTLQQQVFDMTRRFPSEEKYSMTDQIRRSSRSIGANISEAWAKRKYPAHFVSKLSDADGEAEETVHWIESAFACGYILETMKNELVSGYRHIGGMIYKMMNNSESWCKNYLVK